MTITKREILFSIIILCVFLTIGFFIGEKIQDKASERAEVYLKAVQITEPGQFQYGVRTNIGNVLAYGEFKAVDPVTLPELLDEYFYIERVTQRYTMHTRTITEKDSNGKTTTRTETYYEWDTIGRDAWTACTVRFMGEEYPSEKLSVAEQRLSLGSGNVTGNIKLNYRYERSSYFHSVGDLRYYYNYVPPLFSGTILASLQDGSFQNPTNEGRPVKVEYERQIEDVIESAKKAGTGGLIVFWIIWVLLTGGVIAGFVYLDNHWLESGTHAKTRRRFR